MYAYRWPARAVANESLAREKPRVVEDIGGSWRGEACPKIQDRALEVLDLAEPTRTAAARMCASARAVVMKLKLPQLGRRG